MILVYGKQNEEKLELENRLQELKLQLDEEIAHRENEISARIEAYVGEQKYKHEELEIRNERLKQEHQISLEILREENDSIREHLEEKASALQELNDKLKTEYEQKQNAAEDEIALLKEENRKILETFKSDTKDNKLQVTCLIRVLFILFKCIMIVL